MALGLVVSGAAGCRTRGEPQGKAASAPSTSAQAPRASAAVAPQLAEPPPPPPPPKQLTAEGPFVALPVEGFRDAVVSVPLGATEPRPVVVALHGNYDRPEWQCDVWRDITRAFPFVLCPRGVPRSDAPASEDRWTYSTLGVTEKELMASLEALQARFPEFVAKGPVVFTGFSLGAIFGRHIVQKHAEQFPRAVLVEGGYQGWSRALGARFLEAGGDRVLFGCGQSACKHASQSAARALKLGAVEARVADGGQVGHTYDGPVAAAVRAEWDWLVEKDERFTK